MRDDAAEIDQDPTAFGIALRARDAIAGFPRAFDDRVGDRSRLHVRAAVYDNERIGENGAASQIEDGEVFAFFLFRCVTNDVNETRLMRQCFSPLQRVSQWRRQSPAQCRALRT